MSERLLYSLNTAAFEPVLLVLFIFCQLCFVVFSSQIEMCVFSFLAVEFSIDAVVFRTSTCEVLNWLIDSH